MKGSRHRPSPSIRGEGARTHHLRSGSTGTVRFRSAEEEYASESEPWRAVYLLFTLALSSVFYFLIAKSGRVGGGWGAYIGCLMWCPGVAALLSCKYLRLRPGLLSCV
jgi:hypothetical protein